MLRMVTGCLQQRSVVSSGITKQLRQSWGTSDSFGVCSERFYGAPKFFGTGRLWASEGLGKPQVASGGFGRPQVVSGSFGRPRVTPTSEGLKRPQKAPKGPVQFRTASGGLGSPWAAKDLGWPREAASEGFEQPRKASRPNRVRGSSGAMFPSAAQLPAPPLSSRVARSSCRQPHQQPIGLR